MRPEDHRRQQQHVAHGKCEAGQVTDRQDQSPEDGQRPVAGPVAGARDQRPPGQGKHEEDDRDAEAVHEHDDEQVEAAPDVRESGAGELGTTGSQVVKRSQHPSQQDDLADDWDQRNQTHEEHFGDPLRITRSPPKRVRVAVQTVGNYIPSGPSPAKQTRKLTIAAGPC